MEKVFVPVSYKAQRIPSLKELSLGFCPEPLCLANENGEDGESGEDC